MSCDCHVYYLLCRWKRFLKRFPFSNTLKYPKNFRLRRAKFYVLNAIYVLKTGKPRPPPGRRTQIKTLSASALMCLEECLDVITLIWDDHRCPQDANNPQKPDLGSACGLRAGTRTQPTRHPKCSQNDGKTESPELNYFFS